MKICFINPTIILRRPIAELSEMLAARGYEVSILWPTISKGFDSNWHAAELVKKLAKNEWIKLVPLPCLYSERFRYYIPRLSSIRAIKNALKNNDIVQIWGYFYPVPAFALLLKLFFKPGARVILTIDGIVGYLYKNQSKLINTLLKIYTKTFGRLIFQVPDKITLYSEILLPYAKKAGIPIKNAVVTPTGIHLEKFKKIETSVRKEFNISNKDIVILLVGMITERKGIDILLRLTKKLIVNGYNIKALIVGSGPNINRYKQMSDELNINYNIVFTGNRYDIPAIMSASDIFILPSRGEGLSGAIMEAMACSLPVIATDDGLTRDIVLHGKTGFLFKMLDEKKVDEGELFNYAKKLINSQELRIKMGILARQHIKNFDWDKIVLNYIKNYKLCLSN